MVAASTHGDDSTRQRASMSSGTMSKRAVAERELSKLQNEIWSAGRNHGPRMLWHWWIYHEHYAELAIEKFGALVCDVWSGAEWPQQSIGQRDWLEIFATCGFISESGAAAPCEPLTLWRSDWPWSKGRGMSWTRNIEKARWFASRNALFSHVFYDVKLPGAIFEATVPPAAVLACLDGDGSRDESEVVVNPRRLRGRWTPRLIEVVGGDDA